MITETLCRSGEICGGRGSMRAADGSWHRCDCHYFAVRRRRLTNAGIPGVYENLSAKEAVDLSGYTTRVTGCGELLTYMRGVARWLFNTPDRILRIPNISVDTYPLGAWFAASAALEMDIAQTTVHGVVQGEFTKPGNTEALAAVPFLLIWGVGGDPNHSWMRMLLPRLLQIRLAHRRPTVMTYVPGGDLMVNQIYGMTVDDMLSRQRGLV